MAKKLRIGLIFGGRSGEHEVSLVSARSVFNALDRKKYEVKLIGIDKKGKWHLSDKDNLKLDSSSSFKSEVNSKTKAITIADNNITELNTGKKLSEVDVFFPITHGTFGEDGCLQGLMELLNVAYVGSGVLGSAVGMDKDVMKRLFRDAGILTARFMVLKKSDLHPHTKIINLLKKNKNNNFGAGVKFPIFAKPANLGSSVGISKVKNRKELNVAIKDAFKYDTKIILEEYIKGREIECAVLGNDNPVASRPGEIKLQSEFYSYDAKYIDAEAATPVPVANLPKNMIKKIQETAIKVFKVLECSGMGRVDFFLAPGGKLYANEINTLPGFTSISMYPKMWEQSGIPYPKLLDKLIQLAIERKKEKDKLKRNFSC
ncbi:MAG: D-alanine--D-alanine ligase family protein [Patescibacteria group bacterium]